MSSSNVDFAGRRKRLRRLALYSFLGFCVISAVLHFTIGAIMARLFPGEAAPKVVDQAVSILTIYRLAPDARRLMQPTPVEQQKVALRNVVQPKPKEQPVVHQQSRQFDKASLAAAIAPRAPHLASSGSSARHQSSGARATSAVLEVMSPNGFNPADVRPNQGTGSGSAGTAAGEDPSYPGRQAPTGPVWSESGPQGTGSGSGAGGIILEGGGGGAGGHDSCAPSRGGFF